MDTATSGSVKVGSGTASYRVGKVPYLRCPAERSGSGERYCITTSRQCECSLGAS